MVVADRQVDLAERLADAIHSNGGSAYGLPLDVRDPLAHKHVVDSALERWGVVDYYFNNAGIGVAGEASDYATEDYDDVFDVNLRGVAYGVQAVYPVMIRQGSGHIVNTASMAGLVAPGGQVAYCASKHGVVGLSKALRIEAKVHGVNVSVMCPGVVRTPILDGGKYGRIRGLQVDAETVRELFERMRPMAPDAFARQALAAVARNQAIIVAPTWWKLFWYLERVSPTLSIALQQANYPRVRRMFAARRAQQPDAAPDAPADGARSGAAASRA